MRTVITGGAGSSGQPDSAVDRQGHEVVVYDNLSRPGATRTRPGCGRHGERWSWCRRTSAISTPLRRRRRRGDIYQLGIAGGVTTSVADPRTDFESRAGTLNVLEAGPAVGREAIVVYASTNKVYGGWRTRRWRDGERYAYRDYHGGFREAPLIPQPVMMLEGRGAHMCGLLGSMGCRPVVVPQSCIYGRGSSGGGPGWVPGFCRGVTGKPITIYGDGRQVRDVAVVDDLLDFYRRRSIGSTPRRAGLQRGRRPTMCLRCGASWADAGRADGRRIEVHGRLASGRPADFVADIGRRSGRWLAPKLAKEEGYAGCTSGWRRTKKLSNKQLHLKRWGGERPGFFFFFGGGYFGGGLGGGKTGGGIRNPGAIDPEKRL